MPMSDHDEKLAEDARRRRLIEERRMRTYLAFAEADALDGGGGRFAALPEQKPTVVGAKAEIAYPQQPEHSHWSRDPVPDEPLIDGTGEGDVLGYAIDGRVDAAATGDPAEGQPLVRSGVTRPKLDRRF